MDKNRPSNNRSRMQEASPTPTPQVGFLDKAIWLGMISAALLGGTLCTIALFTSIDKIDKGRIVLPSKYYISAGTADIDIKVNRFTGRTEGSGTVAGDILPSHSYFDKVTIDPPGKPWLCVASVFLTAATAALLRRVYQITRRRKSAIESTPSVAKITAAGGLMFFAGADSRDGVFLLGLCIMTYAGIGYLAYTRWERVRAQLYRD
jgi:hypothetical protein